MPETWITSLMRPNGQVVLRCEQFGPQRWYESSIEMMMETLDAVWEPGFSERSLFDLARSRSTAVERVSSLICLYEDLRATLAQSRFTADRTKYGAFGIVHNGEPN